jgi:hypothetical protein
VPNSEPKVYPYGSRQKRIENFNALVEFLNTWKNKDPEPDFNKSRQVAERFCDMKFQYGYVTKKDITEQALMKVNLI